MKKAQAQALAGEQYIILPLLAVVLLVNAFLFSVTYTNASFSGLERPLPQVFSPARLSQDFDRSLSIVADNLRWSVTTALAEVKEPALYLLGLQDYKFGQPRYTALASQANWRVSPLPSLSEGTVYAQAEKVGTPRVLGAFTVNYEFVGK